MKLNTQAFPYPVLTNEDGPGADYNDSAFQCSLTFASSVNDDNSIKIEYYFMLSNDAIEALLNNESARLSLGAASKFDLKQAFEEISFPFLIMTGDHDPNLTSSQDMLNHSDTGELRILKNVGHGSVLQRPDLTVKNFLDWHGKR